MSIENEGIVDPDFKVKFMTTMLDTGTKQGLAVTVGGKLTKGAKRRAIAIWQDSTPAKVAKSLHELADWLAEQSEVAE